jgi:hypothetical protein
VSIYVFTITVFCAKGFFALIDLRPTLEQMRLVPKMEAWKKTSSEYESQWRYIESFMKDYSGTFFSPIRTIIDREVKIDSRKLWEYINPLGPIAPQLVGLDSPKNYLVVFQNPAEARGTGGIIGLFAVVEVSKSGIEIKQIGSNSILQSLDMIPIKMPSDYVNLYGSDPAIWQNSNLSPHFPYGAKIYLELFRIQFGQQLDGVIAVDSFVLEAIMKNLNPININGIEINYRNVVDWTLSKSYSYYANSVNERKAFLVKLVSSVGKELEEEKFSRLKMLSSLQQPLKEHRILIYNSNPDIQKRIEHSQLSGSLDLSQSNEFRLVMINTSGNKMDYYLQREVVVRRKACGNQTEVDFVVKNGATLSMKLPSYVSGRLDRNEPNGIRNSHGVTALLYGPKSSYVEQVEDLDSGESLGYVAEERGRPIFGVALDLAAQQSRHFRVKFIGKPGELSIYTQPLVVDQKNHIIDRCRG